MEPIEEQRRGVRPMPRSLLALAFGVLALSLAWLAPGRVHAEAVSPVVKINEAAAKAEITVERLRGNISVLMGSGGNITVLTGPEGKLLVDAGIAVSRPRIQAALDGISDAPLKYLINTHWHWDHTDGNEWVHQAGATIIAQENTLKRLSTTTRVEDWSFTFQPWPIATIQGLVYPLMNPSSSSLTLSLSVVHMPCGAPL